MPGTPAADRGRGAGGCAGSVGGPADPANSGFGGQRRGGVECDAPSESAGERRPGSTHGREHHARRAPAPHRGQVGRRLRRAPTRSSTRPPRRWWGWPPTPAPPTPLAAAAAAKEAQPGLGRLVGRGARCAHARGGGGHPGQVVGAAAAGDRRDRGHGDGRLAHAGAGGGRPLRALRPRPAGGAADAAAAPAGAGARRWPRAGSSAAWSTASPLGVVACITSYNFPMVNMAGKVAPALAAGNTVVVKPAPQDPLAIVELARILNDVGFPPGVVNLVNGNGPASSAALVDVRRRGLRQLHRVDPGRRDHRREGGPHHEAHPARARRQGRLRRLRRRRREGGHRLHRVDLVLPLGADLHRTHPGRGAPQPLRPGARRPGADGRVPQGRRPDRHRHHHRPGHLGGPAGAHRGAHRHGESRTAARS